MVFSLPLKANAQSLSVGIYPPILQIQANPPASVNSTITIQNQSDQTTTYTINYVPFEANAEQNGLPQFDKELLPLYKDIFSKMQLYDEDNQVHQITLAPKQKKVLKYHIGLPKGEKPGDFYYSIVFTSVGSNENNQNSFLGSRAGIATNVLLNVGPKSPASGFINTFKAPLFTSSGPVNFRLNVANNGQSYFAINGQVLVKNMFGQTIGKVDLLPVNVLANSSRFIPSKDAPDPNNPTVFWKEKFLLGIYTATARVSLSENGPVYNRTTTFFAFPIEGIFGIIVILILVIGIVRRIKAKSKDLY